MNTALPRLLLFEQRLIGDAVMCLPFLRSAAKVFDVHVTCAEQAAAIFKMALPEEKIVPWTPPWLGEGGTGRRKKARLGEYVKRLRAVRADVAASVWADARVHALMRLSGARRRAGFPMTPNHFSASQRPWRRKQIRIGRVLNVAGSILTLGPLLTEKVHRREFYQHHLEDFRDLSEPLGVPWDESKPWLPVREPVRSEAGGRPVWLVHPGARFEGRRWPLASFLAMVREVLLPHGVEVLFIRPPELVDAALPLPPEVRIVAPAGLGELMDLCREAAAILCNDTSVSHMGTALGKTVVSIFSDTEPRWFAPRGNERNIVRQDVCPHMPCLDHCVMPSYICLEAVTYEMVRAKVISILQTKPGAAQ